MRRLPLLALALLAGCTSWVGAPAPHHGAHWEWDYPLANDQVRILLGEAPPSRRQKRYTHYISASFGGEPEPSLIYRWDPEREGYLFLKTGIFIPEDPDAPVADEEPTPGAVYRWAFEGLDRELEQVPRAGGASP